jgi:hypothetical protein
MSEERFKEKAGSERCFTETICIVIAGSFKFEDAIVDAHSPRIQQLPEAFVVSLYR